MRNQLMALEMTIWVKGIRAGVSLRDSDSGRELAKTQWEDKRDLSKKLLAKMDALLRKRGIPLRRVQKISFDCDSPYFARKEKWRELRLENVDASGKCGFTAWQTGEIIAKVMDFALEK